MGVPRGDTRLILERPKDEDLEAALDEWGQEDWQVISLYKSSSSEKVTVVASRQLTLATRRRRSWPGD
jgi:hypothetical protein